MNTIILWFPIRRLYTDRVQRRLPSGLVIFGFFTATGLLFFGYRYLEYVSNREAVSPLEPLINELITGSWTAALLFPLIRLFARRFPITVQTWMSALPLHAGALVLYSVVHTSLMWGSRNVLYPWFGLHQYDYGVMLARYPMEFFNDVFGYALMVSVVYVFDRHVRTAQLEAQLAQARLENLRLQLQPHFLFNALNTISSLVYESPRKADAAIAQLSALLRKTINDADEHLVSLSREVETLELYLNVMRSRFEDKLSVDLRVSPEVEPALVPHLVLQPLVENCIRHGIDPQSNAVTIRLTAERDRDNTRVRIRDFGRGLAGGKLKPGTGISNTTARLKQLYGAEHKLEFEDCEDGGLAVTLAVPYRT